MWIVCCNLWTKWAINSIIDVKEESDIDSLFSAGGTSALIRAVFVQNETLAENTLGQN